VDPVAPAETIRPLAAARIAAFPAGLARLPLLWAATAVDATIVQAMHLVVNRFLLAGESRAAHLRESAAPYLDAELLREPARFFALPEGVRSARLSRTHTRRTMRGGVVLAHRLDTDLAPDDPIRIEHWVHQGRRPAATVLAVHGFTMGWPRFDAIALLATEWFRAGLDVALLTLPFHGPRTPARASFSGDSFARPDVGELNEAARRAVREILLATRWLREESQHPVGLLGLSLGGYLAATTAGLDPDLAFVVTMVPPVCFGDLAWRFLPARHAGVRGVPAALGYDELRRAFRVHSPLAHAPVVARERLLVIAGRGDRIVPPEHPTSLWQHWGEPDIHWFDGSHLAPFGRAGVIAAIRAHLARLDIV
jgi:pimeloyl-ACP methyl ester carboxylesterase